MVAVKNIGVLWSQEEEEEEEKEEGEWEKRRNILYNERIMKNKITIKGLNYSHANHYIFNGTHYVYYNCVYYNPNAR